MSLTVDAQLLQTIAGSLREAEESGRPIEPISATNPALTIQDAYAIQTINVSARPARVVGHKIGLTSQPMQEMLGVNQPDYGVLYDDRVHDTGVTLSVDTLIAPRIEPEFAFILHTPLTGPDVSADDVRAATEYIVPALEVIDSRIRDWKITLTDTVADNASCHCAVLGTERHPVAELDLAAAGVQMSAGDEILQRGVGAAVLGDPAEAVAWLANALHEHGGGLKAGHIVLSGSITAAIAFTAGDSIRADFGALGSVEVTAR